MTESHVVTVAVPSIPHGPVGVPTLKADADYYREAAANIRWHAATTGGFAGSNLTETVAQLCDVVADELEATREKRRAEQRAQFVLERREYRMDKIRRARRGGRS